MTTRPITTRLPEGMDQEIREFWRRQGEKPSRGYRRAIEEWWTVQQLPLIEFRDGISGRRAGLKDGPDVWEVCMVAGTDWDIERLNRHFGGHIPRESLEQARRYQELFPAVISEWLAENERIGRMLERQLT